MIGKSVTGVEAEEARLRVNAMQVIHKILDYPPFDGNFKARSDFFAPPHISSFKRIDPVLLLGGTPGWFVFSDATPSVVWPFEGSLVRDGNDNDWFDLLVIKFSPISPKDVRGYPVKISPYMGLVSIAAAEKRKAGAQMVTAKSIMSWLGGQWVASEMRTMWEGREGREIPSKDSRPDKALCETVTILNGLALRHRYEWGVSLGYSKCPSVRFKTDPTGVKELFRLRDVADGRNKRDALMNWVSDHWRKDRDDPDIERYVRKHLRGHTMFDWRGFECELLPSAFDMDERARFAKQRMAMKEKGDDVRKIDAA